MDLRIRATLVALTTIWNLGMRSKAKMTPRLTTGNKLECMVSESPTKRAVTRLHSDPLVRTKNWSVSACFIRHRLGDGKPLLSCLIWSELYRTSCRIPLSLRTLLCSGYLGGGYEVVSRALLMCVSAFCKLETDRPTAAFRTIAPFTPVSPCCSDPSTLMR